MGGVVSWVREGDAAYNFFSVNRDLYVFARNKRDTFSLKQSELERLQKAFFANIQHKPKPFPADIITRHLFAHNPEVAECFSEMALDQDRDDKEMNRAHENLVRELLVETVNLLKKPVEAASYIYKIGCAHAKYSKYSINPMWSKFYDAISECTSDWFVSDKHPEDEANWQLIISFVVAQLKLGYEEELTKKRQSGYRRGSHNPECPADGRPTSSKHSKSTKHSPIKQGSKDSKNSDQPRPDRKSRNSLQTSDALRR